MNLQLVHQAALQVGGHGERLHQCREVVLTTFKTVPVQVSRFTQLNYCNIVFILNKSAMEVDHSYNRKQQGHTNTQSLKIPQSDKWRHR